MMVHPLNKQILVQQHPLVRCPQVYIVEFKTEHENKMLTKIPKLNSMWLSKIFKIVGVRFTSAGAVGCDEEEECCDGDDENESKPKNYHGKRRPSGMLNLTYRERESLKYVFPIMCYSVFRLHTLNITS